MTRSFPALSAVAFVLAAGCADQSTAPRPVIARADSVPLAGFGPGPGLPIDSTRYYARTLRLPSAAYSYSTATAVNRAGRVVGRIGGPALPSQPVLWIPTARTVVLNCYGTASAINERGAVVGVCAGRLFFQVAPGGSEVTYGTIPGRVTAVAGISDSSVVVGTYVPSGTSRFHAFRFESRAPSGMEFTDLHPAGYDQTAGVGVAIDGSVRVYGRILSTDYMLIYPARAGTPGSRLVGVQPRGTSPSGRSAVGLTLSPLQVFRISPTTGISLLPWPTRAFTQPNPAGISDLDRAVGWVTPVATWRAVTQRYESAGVPAVSRRCDRDPRVRRESMWHDRR